MLPEGFGTMMFHALEPSSDKAAFAAGIIQQKNDLLHI
jgi:hypothetical protein